MISRLTGGELFRAVRSTPLRGREDGFQGQVFGPNANLLGSSKPANKIEIASNPMDSLTLQVRAATRIGDTETKPEIPIFTFHRRLLQASSEADSTACSQGACPSILSNASSTFDPPYVSTCVAGALTDATSTLRASPNCPTRGQPEVRTLATSGYSERLQGDVLESSEDLDQGSPPPHAPTVDLWDQLDDLDQGRPPPYPPTLDLWDQLDDLDSSSQVPDDSTLNLWDQLDDLDRNSQVPDDSTLNLGDQPDDLDRTGPVPDDSTLNLGDQPDDLGRNRPAPDDIKSDTQKPRNTLGKGSPVPDDSKSDSREQPNNAINKATAPKSIKSDTREPREELRRVANAPKPTPEQMIEEAIHAIALQVKNASTASIFSSLVARIVLPGIFNSAASLIKQGAGSSISGLTAERARFVADELEKAKKRTDAMRAELASNSSVRVEKPYEQSLLSHRNPGGIKIDEVVRQEPTDRPVLQDPAAYMAELRDTAQFYANLPTENEARKTLSPARNATYEAIVKIVQVDMPARRALQQLMVSGKLENQALRYGEDLLTILGGLAIGNGDAGPNLKEHVLASLLEEIAEPNKIRQGTKGTCAATVVQIKMARNHPAEYARLVAGLASEIGEVKSLSGELLLRKVDWLAPDGGRTSTSRLIQPAFMELANGRLRYDNSKDLNIEDRTQNSYRGLHPAEKAYLEEKVLGSARRIVFPNATDAMEQIAEAAAKEGGINVSIKYPGREDHAVLVLEVTKDRVYFANPWGREESMLAEEFRRALISAELAARR